MLPKDSKTFCPVPFSTLIFNPDGKVGVCREKGSDHFIGDITKQALEEIWNSPRMQDWRREFLEGNIRTCADDMRQKSCHCLASNRDLLAEVDISLTPRRLLRFSPDFNGHCNLGCGICHVREKPNGLYDRLKLWPMMEEKIFPQLRQMDPLSGEPFIQKDLYRLIDRMAELNPGCEWRFTTNGHWRLSPYIQAQLDRIQIGFISISIDSLSAEKYASIRKGRLERVLKTVDELLEYRKDRIRRGLGDFKLIVNCTIFRENWRELPALIEFPLQKGILPFVQVLYRPEEFSVLTLSEAERIGVLEYCFKNLSPQQFPYSHRLIRALAESLPSGFRDKFTQLFQVAVKSDLIGS
ncbi:MAG: hypothetical protein A2070_03745 [Bdellovibrionales bacterium GWC1_52_8]|nr:MAG: hypothetical protein A2Z97_15545 [Bdellovibrionales bacterium GWB1_52_6]OFZ02904.1 MAG: hypothetical protein A2X97_04850 [Bdellovibrionales bacterium GWA1_52_35]OFZ37375.1 MAG: hypothetical protein A2070_03745 [Bdellovibrionales bacterium GWC1_52_8]HCM38487.1 hypothetical protein [Bdellovibrionales bacterium]